MVMAYLDSIPSVLHTPLALYFNKIKKIYKPLYLFKVGNKADRQIIKFLVLYFLSLV